MLDFEVCRLTFASKCDMLIKTVCKESNMDFFKTYTSNTLAGSGNQSFFRTSCADTIQKGRVLYKVFAGGAYQYSLLFSNIIDSTFADGTHSHKNLIVDEWTITEARVGITSFCNAKEMTEPTVMHTLTFDGKREKLVHSGEFFSSDPILLAPNKDEYICLELSFKGGMIPYHEESILPTFLWDGEKWEPSKRHPFASMIGCDRPVKKKIAFLGDSITQGIGTRINSYGHWNAVVADALGEDYSYWNLGLGYGRADDAASDGAWLYKAKQNDIVVVCYGVNDLFRGFTVEQIKMNLEKIIDILHGEGIKVVLQSVPPFDYSGDTITMWQEVNRFVRETLAAKADMFFDCADLLKKSDEEPYKAPFGGHPNEAGCKLWGDALACKLKEFLAE